MELLVGFASGRIETRKHRSGELLQTNQLKSSVAQLFYTDFRMNGSKQVVAVSTEGDVKGMTITKNLKQFQATDDVEERKEEQRLHKLNAEKNQLLQKLEQVG